jgi:hypothetical protein
MKANTWAAVRIQGRTRKAMESVAREKQVYPAGAQDFRDAGLLVLKLHSDLNSDTSACRVEQ